MKNCTVIDAHLYLARLERHDTVHCKQQQECTYSTVRKVHAVLYVSHVLVAHYGFNDDRQWHSQDCRMHNWGMSLPVTYPDAPNCSRVTVSVKISV